MPVDLECKVKHIRKPNGAKPGYVIYENQNDRVTPEEEKDQAMTKRLIFAKNRRQEVMTSDDPVLMIQNLRLTN